MCRIEGLPVHHSFGSHFQGAEAGDIRVRGCIHIIIRRNLRQSAYYF